MTRENEYGAARGDEHDARPNIAEMLAHEEEVWEVRQLSTNERWQIGLIQN